MKRIATAFVLCAALVVAVGYSVWRANLEPVTTPPSEVEIGRQKLHAQLEDAKGTEAQIEKQDWNSPALLEQVIAAHQQRIDKLKDNSQAGEIVAHDREAIDRLQKRIEEIRAKAAADAAAAEEATAAEESAQDDKPETSAPSAASHPVPATPSPRPAPTGQSTPGLSVKPKVPGQAQNPATKPPSTSHSTPAQPSPRPAAPVTPPSDQ